MKIYSIPVTIAATAYVRAATVAEAVAKLAAHDISGGELPEGFAFGSLPISGLQFDDPNLPEVSLSPAMTVHAKAHIVDAECVDVGSEPPLTENPFR